MFANKITVRSKGHLKTCKRTETDLMQIAEKTTNSQQVSFQRSKEMLRTEQICIKHIKAVVFNLLAK